MKCTDLEILLCDYVDGTLSPAEKATVELHLSECADCRELAEDSKAALSLIERASAVEPPPALVNHILFEARKTAGQSTNASPTNWFRKLLEPILQPRFAMGMAMTILSFAMLGRFIGIPARQLKPSDLEPAHVVATLEDRAYRTWDRAKKYYESLRVVYEIRQTLSDWKENVDPAAAPGDEGPKSPSPAGATGQSAPKASSNALEGPIGKEPQGDQVDSRKDGRAK